VDALIVFTSVKYLAILITADNLLLRAAEPVKAAVKAQIMTARQAIELVRSQISGRDQMAQAGLAPIVRTVSQGLFSSVWIQR
jgi:hypothetical protein